MISKPNPIKPARVVMLLILMPLVAPLYLVGAFASLVTVTVYCGFKNTENFFMQGLGFESAEQTIERVIKENLK